MSGFVNELERRVIYVHPMTYTGARAIASVLRGLGLKAEVFPPSDDRTLALGALYSNGEECYPLKITLGDILKVLVDEGIPQEEVAILMPGASGPCRFGQYVHYMRRVLKEIGFGNVLFVSPSCEDGYESFEAYVGMIQKPAWTAIVASDILRKLLLMFRPYADSPEEVEKLYESSLDSVCAVIEEHASSGALNSAVKSELVRVKKKFLEVRLRREKRPLIGIVGEIFCRLNKFSNTGLLKKIEELGGECWQSDVAEWIFYTDRERERNLRKEGLVFSLPMLKAKMKYAYEKKVEHELYSVFEDVFKGREEPSDVTRVLEFAGPYLPRGGALGEMIISVGKVRYFWEKGASGVVDISPFSCMNGIVSEAIYYRMSQDLGGFPIKVFYFDESHRDVEYELEIFLDMAREYDRVRRGGEEVN